MIMKTLHTIYTNFAKRLALVLALLLTFGVTFVWGAEKTATLNSTCFKSDANNYQETEGTIEDTSGGEWKVKGYGMVKGTSVTLGKGNANYLQTPNFSGNISKIKVICSGSYYLQITDNNGNVVCEQQKVSDSPLTYTVSGSYSQLKLFSKRFESTSNAATTITEVVVTYNTTPACEYTVQFKPNGGTGTMSDQTFTCDVEQKLTANSFSKTGYTFDGWNTKDDGQGTSYTNQQLVSNLAANGETIPLFAQWTAKTSTVFFDQNGGEGGHTTSVTATYGQNMPTPITLPTRYGHTFGGYYDGEGGTGTQYYKADGTSANTWNKTSASATLYAKWTEKNLVRYRTSCECIPPAVTIQPTSEYGWRYSIGETIGLNAIVESASGDCTYQWQKYVVDQWQNIAGATSETFTKENCTTNDGGSYRCVVNAGNDCIAESEPYYVRVFTLDGYYYNEEIAANKIVWTGENTGVATIHLGQSRTYLFKVTDNEGKWFGYGDYAHFNYIVQPWRADCGIETGNGTNTDIRLFTGPEGDYTFTINIEHALDNEPYVNIAVAYPEVEHPVAGYGYITKWWDNCYIHWWDNNSQALTEWGSDAQITTYTEICETEYYYFPIIDNYVNLIIKDAAGDPSNTTGDQTQTGHSGWYITHDGNSWGWHEFATYTITFNANGGNGTMDALSGICPTTDKTLTTNAFTRSGYTFAGWKANKNVTINGVSVVAGTLITDCATIQNIVSDITLTAQWTPKNITITWDANGGSVTPTSSTYTYNGATITPPTPTRANYTFNGWFTATTGGTKITEVGTTNKPTEDVTYYAQWTAKPIPTLQWSAPTCTATVASPSNEFPTLTVTPEAIRAGVQYSSSIPAVATIDATGRIVLKSAGTTTIRAYYEEDNTYASAEDTYELTVEESDNCRWEEVTINDIEYGDEVVITMAWGENLYALPYNSETASNSNPLATLITSNNFAGTIANELIWYITKGEGNIFTLSPKTATNKYLTCNSSNNAVRIDNDLERYFTIENDFLKNINFGTYLAISTTAQSKDWRHYASNNATIANKYQTLKLYKKVCLPSNISRVTYSVGNGDTAPAEQEVENNTSITLPSITTNLTCVNFVGWTDAASGYTHGTDKLYKAGDSYTVTENVTLHAVYAAGGGYVLVEDVATLTSGMQVIIANTDNGVAMGAQKSNNRGAVEVTISDKTLTPADGVEIFTLEVGTIIETFALKASAGYISAVSSKDNYLRTQSNKDANGSWKITIADGVTSIIAQGDKTRNTMQYNSGSDLFSCYASASQSPVSLYAQGFANYTTDPACVTYEVTTCTSEHGTISVDPTTVDPYGSTTVTFTPDDGYMLQAVTVTSGTAEVGTPSYTTSQISGGTVRITDIQSDIEVCANFVEIPYYKVTFVDMNNGNSTEIVSQSGFGADITAPTTASDGCDATWTFIGWAPNNSLNGASEIPSGLVAPGGTISGSLITDNSLTYYSVYSNSSDGTPPFSIGKSGTYYFKAITENSDVYYATGEFTGSDRYNTNSTPNIPFLLTYNSTTGKYTIKNTLSNKYLAPDSYDENALTEQDASYGWDVIQPTLYADKGVNAQAKTGEYLFSYTKSDGTSVRYLYCNGSYFDSWTKDNSKYALYLEPASEMRYYNASSCTELVTMTFDVPADAELTYENGYPEGYYKDSEKKNVSTFPTLTYEGWTFIGWTAGASYNDQIGDANLDDENSSPNAPSETIYKTGGVSYYLGADVTMYPVFTKFADNEPFDMVNGGDYYIYYIADGDVATSEDEYGTSNRIYAGGWGSGGTSDSYGATQSCASATLFTFTKLSNGKWSIYDNTKGRYLCAGATDNNLALNTTTATYGEWTITVHNGNQVNAVSKEGYTLSAYSQDAVTGTFKNYATSNFNHNSAYFHRVYVGTCTERVYSSNPSNKPKITLNGTAAVTSTKDQTIRSAKSLTLSAVKLAANGTITLTSDNADVYFSTDKTANFSKAIKPVASLTINADANGKLALTTVYVHYKPAAVPTNNLNIQTVTITATTGTDGQPNYATATTTATVRNLPADFVIAAKVNDIWYALPNNCNSTSIVNGLPIDVDDPINPTSATFAPAEAKWGLKPVYTTSGANDRYADYGEYFVFAETNTGTAGLLYSNKDNAQVQTQGTYSGISGYQEISRYEWIPTTTDLITYQLAGAQDSKQLNINVNGVFGTHSQLIAENELRLLPIVAIYQHAEVQVVEWRADAVVFMYTSDPNHSVTATLASTSTTKSLSEIKFDHGVYKMPVSNLLSNAGKTMSIKFLDGSTEVARTEITIPVIINGETNTSSLTALAKADYETLDVVILNGGKLTATEGDAAKYRFRNVTVYGGGKLVIGEGKYLSMASIILRAGGFANDGTYEYVYPQFELKGNLTNTAGKFYYDYITDYDHWYHLVLPFAGDLGTIKYPTEFYGSNVTTSNSGSWIIKRYAGDIRATGNYKAWVDIETDNPKPTATTPGVGYIFWGAPKTVTVNGDKQRQQWGIQRISMTKGAGTAKDEEKADKTISNLSSYENVANNSGKDNDQGWNLIGNPYMVNLADMSTSGLHACKLVPVNDAAGNWTGKWEWNDETNIRYLTIPSEHFDTYTAKTVTQAVPLVPGRAFFIQLEGEANGVTFSAANRASLLAARVAANEPTTDIETGIVLSNETMQDEVNIWIKDGKTNDYEYNADYPKTPNNTNFNIYGVHAHGDLSWVATGPEYAEESMPIGYQVPAAGTYTLSLSETYYSDLLDALYVTDHAMSPELTVDLMSNSYEFSVNQAETNNERFTVSLKLKSENQGPATGLENIGVQTDGTIKFIYHDKIFILHNGTIYDATGKQVTTINK